MLLVLQTWHPISTPPPTLTIFPLCALSLVVFSLANVTQVTVEWKINKIKGKSLAFRQ